MVFTVNGSLLWASLTYIVDYNFLRGMLGSICARAIVVASCIFTTLDYYIPSSIKNIAGRAAAILTFKWKMK